jgi:hypothetical protein
LLTSSLASESSVEPATSANVTEAVLAPRVPDPVTFTVPALIVIVPVRVFAPVSVSVPVPLFTSPADPWMIAEMVAVLPVPSALTVMPGVVPAKMRLLVATPSLVRIQLPAVAVSLSPKTRLVRCGRHPNSPCGLP